jgi:UDP-glucose 4-epimerase
MRGKVLVTGGAGYIGSHVVKQLGERGEQVLVLDNLSTGFADAVLYGQLIVGDTGDSALVDRLIEEHNVEAVLHFAAKTIVPESVADPLKYYGNNTAATLSLLKCCQRHKVRHFIFSSTAAVYGLPEAGRATESSATQPINPYGTSKLLSELMLRDLCQASDMRAVVLRYFNVAGCDPAGKIGQSTKSATLLIKVACEVALGKRPHLTVYGTDYPTPDGTGVRDYIHVHDLAAAHLAAIDYLREGGTTTTLNCGYGHGYSVRQVIEAVNRNHGRDIMVVEDARRLGDPPSLVSDVEKIRATLKWTPSYDDLDKIVQTSLAWEHKLAARQS